MSTLKTVADLYAEWGTREFYQAKAADVDTWLTEFMDLMYPAEDTVGLTDEQAERAVHTGRVRATWIVERLIECGLRDEVVKLIAERPTQAS